MSWLCRRRRCCPRRLSTSVYEFHADEETPAPQVDHAAIRSGEMTAGVGAEVPSNEESPAHVRYFAVGGALEHRVQRKLLVDSCCPRLQSSSYALEGSMYNDNVPFRIPSWIPSVMEPPVQKAECGTVAGGAATPLQEADVLLVIGHIHDEEFNSLRAAHPKLPDDNIWIMGGSPSAFNLKVAVGHVFPAETCPTYSIEEWQPTLELYPELLKRLRSFQWGGFLSSRLLSLVRRDEESGLVMDAFYRQFNLHDIVRQGKVLEFEEAVLKQRAGEDSRFSNVLRQLERVDVLELEGQALFEHIYAAYLENGPWDESAVHCLTDSLLEVIPLYTKLAINEYDSYVTHRMLRHYAGEDAELSPQEHMRFVRYCLQRLQSLDAADEEKFCKYVLQLRKGIAGRCIMVLHDLGLDPMSDDWLAIAVLTVVAGVEDISRKKKRKLDSNL
eukprot:TRINITY_DN84917_c0_g1_i1.p1 TRINITY_DN84917_c0_g1~~TRINITY_DN84917_c0_g1_i1.p1  ORF type:complete len:443 (-),score=55.79 TRINITY_DN84917_c0_g1_i1:46-1374(-)